MGTRTVVIVAGFVGGLGWSAKMVIMAGQGGPDPASSQETLAFLVGLLGVLAASVAFGANLTRTKALRWRALASAATVLSVGLMISLGQAALPVLPGDSWVQEEAIFGVVGLLAVLTATATLRRSPASESRPG